jgi:excisionase family DNA binding protein
MPPKEVWIAMQYPEDVRATIDIKVPTEVMEMLAVSVASQLGERLRVQPEQWIGVEQAAAHLACPKSRIYDLVSARRVPHERDGSRLLFRRSDLDSWVSSGGGRRR